MFARRLQALAYPAASNTDPREEGTFRSLLVWLEDTKIRQYRIEDRAALRDVNSATWPDVLSKVRKVKFLLLRMLMVI